MTKASTSMKGLDKDHNNDSAGLTEDLIYFDLQNMARLSVEMANDAILWIKKNGNIAYVNSATAQLMRLSREDCMKLTVFEFFGWLDGAKWDKCWHKIKKCGSKTIESKYKRQDGVRLQVSISFNYIENASREYLVAFVRDVSDRKEKIRRLKNVTHELETLIYRASHDLRAPITSNLGLVSLAKKEAKPSQLVYLDLIEKTLKKQDGIIKEITDISKNVNTELVADDVDIKDLIHTSVINYKANVDENKFNVITFFDVQSLLFSDVSRLKMIVNNLVSNAFNFYDKNKSRTDIVIEVGVDEDKATIMVSDNGIGIASECKKDVFKMFYRGSEMSEGSGLGLYIAKRAVEKLKGKISFTSKAGIGTSFKVEIPNYKKVIVRQ
ncbi:MAG: ATP-binding protein [Bacteroidota bacterium]